MKIVRPFLRPALAAAALLLAAGTAARAQAPPPSPPPAPCPCPAAKPAAVAAAPAAVKPPVLENLPSISRSERYTAQRKPRLTVYAFEDTNKSAEGERYRASVEAMLVTFLKRKSQFVVVERQKLGGVLEEWKRNRDGETNLEPQSRGADELLEKIDTVVLGSVTLLDAPKSVRKVGEKAEALQGGDGLRIEIDIKALSRSDGRIIAAAHSSGPVACLRSVVDRLGVALEREFLRPYYGKLKFHLPTPENVQVFLTPILLDKALDEEKPPVELGESVIMEAEQDQVEPWITDPTSYTIENLLTGWYTLRLERPGYRGIGIENGNEDWVARELGGKVQVLYQSPGAKTVPFELAPTELSRFVVHVDPRDTGLVDGDHRTRGFSFAGRKMSGSLAPKIKRQLLDEGYDHSPARVILIGTTGLDINRLKRPKEFAEDLTCDLWAEKRREKSDYGRTHVKAGKTFDFESFRGGDLVIEDYRGGPIPTGEYEIVLWEPYYDHHEGIAVVNDRDEERPVYATLDRKSLPLTLATTGPRRNHHLLLAGDATGPRQPDDLSFDRKEYPSLPADRYTVSTDVPGLEGWRRSVELLPADASPPAYDPSKDEDPEGEHETRGTEAKEKGEETARGKAQPRRALPISFPKVNGAEETPESRVLRVKTRLAVGGRLAALASLAPISSEEIYIDESIGPLLAAALGPKREVIQKKRSWLRRGSRKADGRGANTAPAAAEPELRDLDPAARLSRGLEDLDLLILDDEDMVRLEDRPEVAAVVARYVASGGSVYAFVSEPGDYGEIVGTPFAVEAGRKSKLFEVAQGEVPEVQIQLDKKRVRIGGKRRLARVPEGLDGWRVVAFTTPGKGPRIVERGERTRGGYVALWLDRPALFRTRLLGNRVPAIEQNRARVERHVLDWSRATMRRRYQAASSPQVAQVTPPEKVATAPQAEPPARQAEGAETRLKALDELRRQGLITDEEYARKRAEILGSL